MKDRDEIVMTMDERKPDQKFALAGNQKCGKTTLFNQLTSGNQHVGDFPGVTADRKDGTIRNHLEATVTDLPGIYSFTGLILGRVNSPPLAAHQT